jgi:hypothetical protein
MTPSIFIVGVFAESCESATSIGDERSRREAP